MGLTEGREGKEETRIKHETPVTVKREEGTAAGGQETSLRETRLDHTGPISMPGKHWE